MGNITTEQQQRQALFQTLEPAHQKALALWRSTDDEISAELAGIIELLQVHEHSLEGDVEEMYTKQAEYIQTQLQSLALYISANVYRVGLLIEKAENHPGIYRSLGYDNVHQWMASIGIDPHLVHQARMRVIVWKYIQILRPEPDIPFLEFIRDYDEDKLLYLYRLSKTMDRQIDSIKSELTKKQKGSLPSGERLDGEQRDNITIQAQNEYRPQALATIYQLRDHTLANMIKNKKQLAGKAETPYLEISLILTPEGTGYMGRVTGGTLDLTQFGMIPILSGGHLNIRFKINGELLTIARFGDMLLEQTEAPSTEDDDDEDDMLY